MVSWRKSKEDEKLFQVVASEREDPYKIQVGDDKRFLNMTYQPIQFIEDFNLNMFQGSIIKHLARWNANGDIEDIKKALHYARLAYEADGNWIRKTQFQELNFANQFQSVYAHAIISHVVRKDWSGTMRFLLRLLDELDGDEK